MCVAPPLTATVGYAAQVQAARANEMLAQAQAQAVRVRAPQRAEKPHSGVTMRDFPSWLAGVELGGPDGSAHRDALADADRRIAAVVDQVRKYTFGGGFGGPDAERS